MTQEWDIDEAGSILTMHCPAGAPEAWVQWDASASTPAGNAEAQFVADRHLWPPPRQESPHHIGYAKAAIAHEMYRGVANETMTL